MGEIKMWGWLFLTNLDRLDVIGRLSEKKMTFCMFSGCHTSLI